uniref:Secreted protein n=1 Tax=Rhipicephalus appendiculatus TaxID=34631 RepID=A0A131YDC9_RHIAP
MATFSNAPILLLSVVAVVILSVIENESPPFAFAVRLSGCCGKMFGRRRAPTINAIPRYRPHPPPNNTHRHHHHHHQQQQEQVRHPRQQRHDGFSTHETHAGGPRSRPRRSMPNKLRMPKNPNKPGLPSPIRETAV